MANDFHNLCNVVEVTGDDGLFIHRARALLAAIKVDRDYSLVQVLKTKPDVDPRMEILIVDVECDGVPSKNAVGIEFRERIALCVPADDEKLVEIAAMRKGFPVLMHQNHGSREGPASLCLYFEPVKSVLRTWTPQRFLRRIQWWLEQSAKGELHAADQPVEQLFFVSKYELVLPWNIGQLRADPNLRPIVQRGPQRSDGATCFLHFIPRQDNSPRGTVTHIEIELPAIVQGFIERDPTTFGELADALTGRGIDLLAPLKEALAAGVGAGGIPVEKAESLLVVALNVPIARDATSEPTQVSQKAFVIDGDVRELGVATGALMVHEKRYFRDEASAALGVKPSDSWRSKALFPMEVLRTNDAAASRRQSSVDDEGPTAVLVGAGSLGSSLLNLWGRSGWGRWTAIDKDHIKPHNLVRHVAFAQHIGQLKVDVVAELTGAFSDGALAVKPIGADATNKTDEAVTQALEAAELVVDASSALDYPRLSSNLEGVGRHISVFLTPSGNGAVLMAEDAQRTVRLRTLEAQYYRAAIRQPWGEHHLDGNLATFWSGASCRDISVALPYSRISAHAATLAEQTMVSSRKSAAGIRVWQRDAESGAVTVHDVEPIAERKFELGDMPIFLDEGLIKLLQAAREEALPAETGGVLLGYIDFNVNAIVVVDALAAPPDSEGTTMSFERGVAGLSALVEEASRRTAGIVGYIGEWHSHPRGHPASPSRADLIQLAELALRMDEDGLPVLQLIVGDGDDLQLLQGEVHR
ncbi:integrative and conjugative element protein, VC0181 family [Variovorax sp. HW608]|uniref:Mov34/MPN/PAD-1 family protein n=1 Tax=Variovorax sp. HW608 TaxID=1034889 RepID=UPI00081F9A9B|nr:Mov34/MPN/PAD-1 family protein [Variovorax sp. HW608]SCK11175.1 integrative and conjugative element protein, VC0181 family [Variovorax sp. HW608]